MLSTGFSIDFNRISITTHQSIHHNDAKINSKCRTVIVELIMYSILYIVSRVTNYCERIYSVHTYFRGFIKLISLNLISKFLFSNSKSSRY